MRKELLGILVAALLMAAPPVYAGGSISSNIAVDSTGVQTNHGAVHHNLINSGEINVGGGEGGEAIIEEGAVKNVFKPENTNTNTNIVVPIQHTDVDVENRNINKNTNVNINDLSNRNMNINKVDNTDVNINHQGQGQGQEQGQNQGQLQGQGQKQGIYFAPVHIEPRPFASPGTAPRASLPSQNAALLDYHTQMDVRAALPRLYFSVEVLDNMRRGKVQTIKDAFHAQSVRDEDRTEGVYVLFTTPETDLFIGQLGFVTVQGQKDDVTVWRALAHLLYAAWEMGANAFMLDDQGTLAVARASGFGIGIGNTLSTIHGSSGQTGNVAVGGTGYSSGQTWQAQRVWMTGTALRLTKTRPDGTGAHLSLNDLAK